MTALEYLGRQSTDDLIRLKALLEKTPYCGVQEEKDIVKRIAQIDEVLGARGKRTIAFLDNMDKEQ